MNVHVPGQDATGVRVDHLEDISILILLTMFCHTMYRTTRGSSPLYAVS